MFFILQLAKEKEPDIDRLITAYSKSLTRLCYMILKDVHLAEEADKNTLKEFETLLGKYGINIKDLNAYYNSLSQKLIKVDSGKLGIANSIWYSQDKSLGVKKDFLQTNADYYNDSAYKADFNDSKTIEDINNWVKLNTGNTIDKIIDEIKPNAIMYLINAVYFEDKWMNVYEPENVGKSDFQLESGKKQSVDFMNSYEYRYLKDDKGEGFTKPYKNGKYSFVALLPNKNISIDDYISSLSGDSFINILKNQSKDNVIASLPKFKSEYKISLVEPLTQMGLKECFDPLKANFTKMAISKIGNIFVGDVLHKTFITVDTEGTKAAAVTKIEMKTGSAAMIHPHEIILNHPFVYAIIDNETNLPIFIGTMMDPK